MSWLKRIVLLPLVLVGACAGHRPMPTVDYVDLERFMGDWYVIANIPTFIERDAHNAVERYSLDQLGRVQTHFSFRQGGFDGELKQYYPTGYIVDEETNAVWGMQFVWPIKADYRVVYLDPQYSITVIGREARDYVWIMAREPAISDAQYAEVRQRVAELGYDVEALQKVPQQWLEDPA